MLSETPRWGIPKIVWVAFFIILVGFLLLMGGLWLVTELQFLTFSRAYRINPGSNPNQFYNVEMKSVHLGAAGENFIVRANVRLKNGGAVPVNLTADAIKLVDAKENLYEPKSPPDQKPGWVLLPNQAESVWLEFTLPAGALDGELALIFPPRQSVRIKNPGAYKGTLREGEFRIMRKLTW